MWNLLRLIFVTVLLSMLALTTLASLDRNLLAAGAELWPDPWFRATLADAYFAFLTIYAWLFYKERSWVARIGWLVGFLLLGNFAIASYVLLQLSRAGGQRTAAALLLRRPAGAGERP